MNNSVVIDTNLLFSFLHKNQAKSAKYFFLTDEVVFCTPNTFVVESFIHKESILKKTKVSEEHLYRSLGLFSEKIHFINESTISVQNFIEAFHLCKDVDEKDISFIALSLEFNAPFWTRDTILKEHLISKGFTNFFDESIL
jgi:predicted nucleic acid-binding protein